MLQHTEGKLASKLVDWEPIVAFYSLFVLSMWHVKGYGWSDKMQTTRDAGVRSADRVLAPRDRQLGPVNTLCFPHICSMETLFTNVFKYLGPNKSILLGNIYPDQKSFTCPSPVGITKLRLWGWSETGSDTDVQHLRPECPDRPAARLHSGPWPAWAIQWRHSPKSGLRVLFTLK